MLILKKMLNSSDFFFLHNTRLKLFIGIASSLKKL